ncbi:MAG: DedA family protein [Candidatus Zambryskibacteria bacterium]|nr:DedA family protein [Candidatus Zambryskibacteria bacterium]
MAQFLDPMFLIKTLGMLGIFAIVFAESGLFFGFFLPGDSLLFTAGFLASQGYLNLTILIVGCALCAIAGDSVGYTFGRKVGPALFSKEDSKFFHKDHVILAEQFYEKHGRKTIILARFVPIVRTFAPIIAGVGKMNYRSFLLFNIIGGILWTVGLTLLGYLLGNVIPDADRYLLPIIGVIFVISILPIIVELIRSRKKKGTQN